ncbi:transposase for insertion sequence element [Corynebacterium variabile DSM 44702]|uniref:Transposase for insertion sequence element n=1 Tax=Corynebacterium variabile (strain DSM 44702 / CIP 107183 / JCM 12073 / NCIMB 30131) TaxID=858619 RepID=G0HHQ1_CORVD|nr:IS1634 family transposase [Corynebacterium variabile]AEK37771.1 transposase for insertion sequence element [Corynebacterium variabile DSM 44702]
MQPRIRTVTTASGATAVQIIYSYAGGATSMEHLGSAHTDAELAALKAEAARRLQGNQLELGLDLDVTDIPAVRGTGTEEQPWEVTAQRSGYLLDAIDTAYRAIGLDVAADNDDVFAGLVTARILQPGSKYDSIGVLAEAGATSASYSTIKRRLPRYATDEFRDAVTAVCADHAGIGSTSLVLYDVTTLYWEADEGDGFREPGFSKERRIDPQITVGMLTDVNGFPLRIQAFEGNRAETKTFLPSVEAFMDTYDLHDVTVVADAGMISEANRRDLDAAGLSYVLGGKTRELPYPIWKWRNDHPGVEYTHDQIWVSRDPGDPAKGIRPSRTIYHYSADRARRTVKGIDESLRKARNIAEGKTRVKRNRYVKMGRATKEVNLELASQHRELAGIKAYVTSRLDEDPMVIIGYYRLFAIHSALIRSRSCPEWINDRKM